MECMSVLGLLTLAPVQERSLHDPGNLLKLDLMDFRISAVDSSRLLHDRFTMI